MSLLIIPVIGVLWYLRILARMKEVPSPPVIQLFFIFGTYGGLGLLIVSSYFLQWSGMSSIGLVCLILFGPILMGVVAYKLREEKGFSVYHRICYFLGILYVPILILILSIFYFVIAFLKGDTNF